MMTSFFCTVLVLHFMCISSSFAIFFLPDTITDAILSFIPGFQPRTTPRPWQPPLRFVPPPIYIRPPGPAWKPILPSPARSQIIMTTIRSTTRSRITTTTKKMMTTTQPELPTLQPERIHRLCYCGTRNEDKSNGQSEIPWRCVISTKKKTGDSKLCGGSLISNQHILTSAHCASSKPLDGSGVTVTCGDPNLNRPKLEVDKIIIHPEYNAANQDHDLAMVHLAKPLSPEYKNDTVCLPWGKEGSNCDNKGTTVLATGWGEGGRDPLKIEEFPCITTEECAPVLEGKYDLNTNMFCTHKKGKDTCLGDSGGSIDFFTGIGMYYVIGVSTPGDNCKSKSAAVYTKVTPYLDWIEEIGGTDSFCKPEMQATR